MKNYNEKATENQVNDFKAAFCPFGWLDLQCALNHAINAGENENWAVEQIENFAEDCGMTIDKCDPVYCVMNSILQEARNEIDNLCGFDIQNDAAFDIYGNYMASSWDTDEAKKDELLTAMAKAEIEITDLSTITQYWLSENEITQEQINAVLL